MDSKTRDPSPNALNPIRSNGSNLLDSFELQAVTQQLNRAIRASNGLSSSPRLCYLVKSPFYLSRMDRIYKENATMSKKISCSKRDLGEALSGKDARGARGFVLMLWNKQPPSPATATTKLTSIAGSTIAIRPTTIANNHTNHSRPDRSYCRSPPNSSTSPDPPQNHLTTAGAAVKHDTQPLQESPELPEPSRDCQR
ncbi:unnamed protein product [Fraxinus pennsylvanica]|uniref:Uncharacterized protein n=1 Tax=Fraxinus pennsylvanica TaxID=56036 RepID=A0AAD1YPP7_9LAMI|nr:unnamed protein product [Fraxinus pennsylvanica]